LLIVYPLARWAAEKKVEWNLFPGIHIHCFQLSRRILVAFELRYDGLTTNYAFEEQTNICICAFASIEVFVKVNGLETRVVITTVSLIEPLLLTSFGMIKEDIDFTCITKISSIASPP